MQVCNVHRRDIDAPVDRVGMLIDGLASRGDRLWPHERWPRMRFDRPGLVAGATGGHGPVGYRVLHHESGRSITFEFTDRPRGLRGHHQFVVQATGPDRCVLWHLTDVDVTHTLRFTWWVLWAPLHDALIEDALTKAQASAEGHPQTPRSQWTIPVRLLRANIRRFASAHPRPNGART